MPRVPALFPVSHLLLRRYRARSALHSFPTRRSSDLTPMHTLAVPDANPAELKRPETAARQLLDAIAEALHGRSEEHTSELQSRVDIVCRLLLEKKKRAGN